MAYAGQIYLDNAPITVEQAVEDGWITADENGSIWLFEDAYHVVNISGDLHLSS